ncbi:hypothetical protein COLO4_05746 [Corchorus olitorius]|uniref:Uncharacterized protein n=1 Tax=Corchorus olitorius TaxID=93759 RepID=A0A1R3KQ01_9ROSI|nr:hypothetical protein COLO4_05746 [Corchorus olitorius]
MAGFFIFLITLYLVCLAFGGVDLFVTLYLCIGLLAGLIFYRSLPLHRHLGGLDFFIALYLCIGVLAG